MIGFPNKRRSTDLGSYPMETLARDAQLLEVESERHQLDLPTDNPANENSLARAAKRYKAIFACRGGRGMYV